MKILINKQSVNITPETLNNAPLSFSLRGRKLKIPTENGQIKVSLLTVMKAIRKANPTPADSEAFRKAFIALKEKGYVDASDTKAKIKDKNFGIRMVSRTLHRLSKNRFNNELHKISGIAPAEPTDIKKILTRSDVPLYPEKPNNSLFFQAAKEQDFVLTRPLMFVLDKEGRLFNSNDKTELEKGDIDLYFYKKNQKIFDAPTAPEFKGSDLYQDYDLAVMTADETGNLAPLTDKLTKEQQNAIKELLSTYHAFTLLPKGKAFLTQQEANIQFIKKRQNINKYPLVCGLTPFGRLIPSRKASGDDIIVEFNEQLTVSHQTFLSDVRQRSLQEIQDHFNK